ncbi:hypothetical protein F4861DRAFT_525387 [Xylaria intraflava]|nr:hypothetical protein F4861DRAFT_525387 [Xylaria intraflava]
MLVGGRLMFLPYPPESGRIGWLIWWSPTLMASTAGAMQQCWPVHCMCGDSDRALNVTARTMRCGDVIHNGLDGISIHSIGRPAVSVGHRGCCSPITSPCQFLSMCSSGLYGRWVQWPEQ